jgi:hypothetical protein
MDVVTIMVMIETIKRTTPTRIHHRLPRTEPSGPVAKHEMKAPKSMKELIICWGVDAMF